MHQRQVGRRKRVGADLDRGNPPIGLAFERAGFTGQDGTSVKTEPDMAPSVVVLGGEDLFVNRDGQPKFFHDLSFQASLEALTGLPLAAGKLPQPAQMGIGRTLGDEDLPIPDDKAGRYLDGRRGFGHGV